MKRCHLAMWATAGTMVCGAAGVFAGNLVLNGLFTDNAVLQRGAEIPVWGSADPGTEVRVSLGKAVQTVKTPETGTWIVRLPALDAGGPYAMTVAADGAGITLTNLLVGDVWLCSGQSNMGFKTRQAANGAAEVAAADFPRIRLYSVPHHVSDTPQPNVEGRWEVCTPETAARFSAVGYFFGRDLFRKLDVPIGLIDSSWGGTPAEAWTPRETLEASPELQPIIDRHEQAMARYPEAMAAYQRRLAAWEQARKEGTKPAGSTGPGKGGKGPAGTRRPRPPRGPGSSHSPAGLYNAMIFPLAPCGLTGVIWYQGESNAAHGWQYRTLLSSMIWSWRNLWAVGDPLPPAGREDLTPAQQFPFLIVQLANFMPPPADPQDTPWAVLRESQAVVAQTVPRCGLALAIDVGEAKNIHPKDKQTVGARLALTARAVAYGEKDLVYSGPVFARQVVEAGRIRLFFSHTGSGLVAKDGAPLRPFAIAGADRKFAWADAHIEPAAGSRTAETVVVSSPAVPAPEAVRYAWANNPEGANLYNREGLPAVPFRTDDWPVTTQGER